eukprot:GHVO01049111.1.p3 GENE.GHVO01049111.1~~GHVO01049111.1.p3  ORF type:complete len:118 (+),score=4.88 GHVO01049111.1:70-423(+)
MISLRPEAGNSRWTATEFEVRAEEGLAISALHPGIRLLPTLLARKLTLNATSATVITSANSSRQAGEVWETCLGPVLVGQSILLRHRTLLDMEESRTYCTRFCILMRRGRRRRRRMC